METSQQQRGSTIGQFAKTLADAKLDFDALDLADILWLVQFIEPVKSLRSDNPLQTTVKPKPKDTEKIDNNEPTVNLYPNESSLPKSPETIALEQGLEQKAEKQSGTPFSVPAAPALRNRLDLARSLRPLMRKVSSRTKFELDEDATVAQIAETGVWLPVVRPVPERWLKLDLVVEESKTTIIWERAIMELNHLVEYQGAFQSVRTWRLSAQTGKVQLFSRWRDGSIPSIVKTELAINQRSHTPGELIDPTGRSLIWLVTDCTSTLWRQSLIYETLLAWSKVQPIAIFQMFPERLWSRTALRDGHIVKLGALVPGLLSKQLVIEGLPKRLEQGNHEDLVTVSIITLDAASMLLWARVASGFGDYRTPGRTFDLSFIRRQAEKGKSDSSPRSSSERTAQEQVALFRSTASKTAQQLADLMAATPVTLPVIDLLRDAFRGDFQEEVQQSHVAEVLLSGLLRRCDTEEDNVCRYEFWGDNSPDGEERVRHILLGDTSILKTIEVLNVLSASICQKLGSPSKTFEALLGDIHTLDSDQSVAVLPFARVGLDVLRRLGGKYAALADKYISVTEPEVQLLKILQLQEFTFEVATIMIEDDTGFTSVQQLKNPRSQRQRIALISIEGDPASDNIGTGETAGQDIYVHHVGEALAQLGWQVDIFTRQVSTEQETIVQHSPYCRTIRLEAGSIEFIPRDNLFYYLPEFVENFLKFQIKQGILYDLIHTNYWLSSWVGMELKKIQGSKQVHTYHYLGAVEYNTTESIPLIASQRLAVEKEVLETAERIVATSPREKQYMRSLVSTQGSIEIIPCGTDIKRFGSIDRQVARLELGIEKAAKLVLYVGRFDQRKGIETLVRAVNESKLRNDNLRLIIGGGSTPGNSDGIERDRIENIINELGMSNLTILPGHLSQEILPTYYAAADVCVVPSHYEPFGLVAIEAMASGTPVVASDVGGLQFTVVPEETGLLAPPENVNAFASAIDRILSNSEWRDELGKAGRQRVVRYFNWDVVVSQLSRLYTQVLQPVSK